MLLQIASYTDKDHGVVARSTSDLSAKEWRTDVAQELVLGSPEAVKKLSDQLALCKTVSRLDVPGGLESPQLALVLADVEKALHGFNAKLHALVEAADPDQTERCLRSIGEDLREITGRVHFSVFYSYIRR